MMDWHRPVLTDSGGYQVFSLRGLQRIDDGGVDYRTHFDGSRHRMTPRSVLESQAKLGSDVCMILDHCPPGDASALDKIDAMERTTRWAAEARSIKDEVLSDDQLCFAIVQGGTDLDLRRRHLGELVELGFDGYALGGLSVGEPVPAMHATMAAVAPTMPADQPRYVMGIGTPADMLAAIRAGVDMFDCVMPSRHARNAQIFTWEGKYNIRQSRFREDEGPLDERCGCEACRRFSRAYLRHLHVANDPLYVRLATAHNLYFFHQWVGALRQALLEGRFERVAAELSEVISRHYPPK